MLNAIGSQVQYKLNKILTFVFIVGNNLLLNSTIFITNKF